MIFIILAAGYPEVALIVSLGHAAFRMIQILRAPNTITDTQNLQSALGRIPWPKLVSDWRYRFSWALRRLDTDFNWLNVPHWISSHLHISVRKRWRLSRVSQWVVTGVSVVVAGVPFTPFSSWLDHLLIEWLPTHPLLATSLMLSHFALSVVLIRFLLVTVLSSRRFRRSFHSSSFNKNPNQ